METAQEIATLFERLAHDVLQVLPQWTEMSQNGQQTWLLLNTDAILSTIKQALDDAERRGYQRGYSAGTRVCAARVAAILERAGLVTDGAALLED